MRKAFPGWQVRKASSRLPKGSKPILPGDEGPKLLDQDLIETTNAHPPHSTINNPSKIAAKLISL
jgi:hypothetical protein